MSLNTKHLGFQLFEQLRKQAAIEVIDINGGYLSHSCTHKKQKNIYLYLSNLDILKLIYFCVHNLLKFSMK